MALLLNIETSSAVCSVCLSRNGDVIGMKEDLSGTNHASLLAVFIRELFDENRIAMKELDAVAVSAGPGSYTGLRIGAATAKGICFSISKPLIAIDSLHALAEGMMMNHPGDEFLFCPTIDARREEIYYSLIDSQSSVVVSSINLVLTQLLPFNIPNEKKILIGGSGVTKTLSHWNNFSLVLDKTTLPSSKHLIHLAEKKLANTQFENVADFEPAYIKPVFISSAKASS